MLALAGRAEAYVYWAGADANTIGRANLDGSKAKPGFIKIPGGNHKLFDLAVDATHIYWADFGLGAVGRANLDGTDVNPRFIVGVANALRAVAVDAGHIYWTGASQIGSANLDGTNPNPSFITLTGSVAIGSDLVVDATHVYWAAAQIGRANLDGTGATPGFISPPKGAGSIAADASHIYWRPLTDPSASTSISRADLNGTNTNLSFIASAGGAIRLAVDADHLYWADPKGAIRRANLDGTSPTSIVTGLKNPGAVAVDALSSAVKPRFGRTVGARTVSGVVLVRLPGAVKSVPLGSLTEIPFGSLVDTSKGRVSITAAKDPVGHLQTGEFYEGVFKLGQDRGRGPAVTLTLAGGNFAASCGAKPRFADWASTPIGPLAIFAGSSPVIRHLNADAKGAFRTKGRYSAATVRGTRWRTEDRCDGTLTSVSRGVVTVADFVRKRTVTVRAGGSYLARRR